MVVQQLVVILVFLRELVSLSPSTLPLFCSQGTAFSLDACCIFPQRVLAIIPLIWAVQLQWPLCAPGSAGVVLGTWWGVSYGWLLSAHSLDSRGRAWRLLTGSVWVSLSTPSWDNCGRAWCLLSGLIAAARACLWSPLWWW